MRENSEKFDPSLKEKNTDKNDTGQMKSLNDCQSALAEIKADKINAIKKDLKKSDPSYENDEKKLDEAVEKETEKTARVPAILHMDREAYNSVCDALNSEEYINLMLMDLGMPKSKKNALIERLKEIKAQAEEAEAVVKKWATEKGLPANDVRGKFFLDPEDYDKIENITDMALDPGMSYFSSEDTQFLTKDETMSKLMSEGDRQKAREITNDERRTQRQNVGALREEEEYRPLVENGIAKKSELKKQKADKKAEEPKQKVEEKEEALARQKEEEMLLKTSFKAVSVKKALGSIWFRGYFNN